MSLYYLENSIIRPEFKDPRIHFGINCGSVSCPLVPKKLFTESNVDQYLDELASDFINVQGGVEIAEERNIVAASTTTTSRYQVKLSQVAFYITLWTVTFITLR